VEPNDLPSIVYNLKMERLLWYAGWPRRDDGSEWYNNVADFYILGTNCRRARMIRTSWQYPVRLKHIVDPSLVQVVLIGIGFANRLSTARHNTAPWEVPEATQYSDLMFGDLLLHFNT
jgi:hypothetical protein